MDAIIYGCGQQGKNTYYKYKDQFNVVNFSDSNEKLHGTSFLDIGVISPHELKKIINSGETALIVASMYYRDIFENLGGIGVALGGEVYYTTCKSGMLNRYNHISSLNFEGCEINRYKSMAAKKPEIKKILFVQPSECARTYKISSCVKEHNIRVGLAYLDTPSSACNPYAERYDDTYLIQSFEDFLSMVNSSDYDIIHSSNAPDGLTVLLLNSNKPVVHDCHDMMSVCYDVDYCQLAEEFISQKYSAGNLYTTDFYEKFAIKKYNLSGKPTFNISNSVSKLLKPAQIIDKLSKKTGEIHCVYEGSIFTDGDKSSHRYFEDIFTAIASQKVHVHFYTPKLAIAETTYFKKLANSPFIHYEGSLEYSNLMTQLTQYDIGLCYYNISSMSEFVMSLASANKLYEYIHAGLPIAVNNLPSMREFVNKYKCGKPLDLDGDIAAQLSEIKKIKISPTLLEDNGLLMEQQTEKLISFYQDVVEYYEKSRNTVISTV